MRNSTLHAILETFISDAALQLNAATTAGEEVPFEVVESDPGRSGRVPLYCYRPLTGEFISARLGRLSALPSYAPAARALGEADGVERYLRVRGEPRIPANGRERGDAALRCLLERVFEERTGFTVDADRFAAAYAELEHALYEGRGVTVVIAPLLGIALDPTTRELPLGEGLSLVAGHALEDAPVEAVYGSAGEASGSEEPNVLAVLTVAHDHNARGPLSQARVRFRRLLSALRLFERGGYALGPLGWVRLDAGAWRPVPIGASGRPRLLTLIPAAQEDELRAFCNLVARRLPGSGEVAWALSRFEMGCERPTPFESLSDYLLALRALLEPEGPASGRLAQRLAVLCAEPSERAALAERTAHTISLERAVIAGVAPGKPGADQLVDELAQHLRELLRDVICGHLSAQLRIVADEILEEAVAAA